MKVLIDTNVLVSAVLLDRTPETVITYVVGSPQMQWVVSDGIMQEYKSVLARDKFGLPLEIIQRWYQLLDEVTLMQPDAESVSFPRDQTDAKFLTTALSARADFLITGDRDFVEAQKLIDTIILSVSQLLRTKQVPGTSEVPGTSVYLDKPMRDHT